MSLSVNAKQRILAAKPVVAEIPFTPSSTLKFAGVAVKLLGSSEKLISALRAKGVEVNQLNKPAFGYVNFEATYKNQKLTFGTEGTEANPGSLMGFSIKTGEEIRTVSHRRVSISSPAKMPKIYANVFEKGLTVDLGDRKPTIKLGDDIHALARALNTKAVRSEGGRGYELNSAATGEGLTTQLQVFANEHGQINRIWDDAESFPDGIVPYVKGVALSSGAVNESGKAELNLSESPSLIKLGIVKSSTTFVAGETAGVRTLTREGL
jgi:hypothetical protein